MPLSDAELFDFNAALIEDYDDEKAQVDLETYGDAFRFQLIAALHLDAWVASLQEDEAILGPGEVRGWVNALKALRPRCARVTTYRAVRSTSKSSATVRR